MSETANQDMSGVAETSLITLYLRAMESQRPDALIKDERAVELVARLGEGQTVYIPGWQIGLLLRQPAQGCTRSCSTCSRLFCPGRAAL
jgi:O-methyltransferase involved in polyketide biosynthesis